MSNRSESQCDNCFAPFYNYPDLSMPVKGSPNYGRGSRECKPPAPTNKEYRYDAET